MGTLDKLDDFYHSKPATQSYMMAALVGLGIGYGIYSMTDEDANKYKEREYKTEIQIKKDISDAKRYLEDISKNGDRMYRVNQLKKQVDMKISQINSYRQKLTKLSNVMRNELNAVLYTNHNWSNFLNDITNKAKENKLKLYKLTNNIPEDTNGSFGKVLEIGVKGQGDYGKILAFINDLEKSKLVTTVGMLNLESTESKPIVDMNMSVWGIRDPNGNMPVSTNRVKGGKAK